MIYREHELLFCPLGGVNEIGMNVNLYHYAGKWLIIDLGAGFADNWYPGVDMVAPDITFLEENKDDILGIVLTHAHEDHLGSIGYLWDRLQCPIYATPFTAEIAKNKLAQGKLSDKAKITIMEPGSRFELGAFDVECVQLTHSAPEMQAIVLHTDAGKIVHTGDWKFDPRPVVGPTSDKEKLKALGDEGVLALVCDSTNVFNPSFSGSEEDLLEPLTQVIKEQEGLVVLTTFASNVARMHTVAMAAQAAGRQVVLCGRSLWRIEAAARECGYFDDIPPFLNDDIVHKHKRSELLIMSTGCQGEPNAATSKIAFERHPNVRLHKGDTVLFSSRQIPGNEKRLGRMLNQFARNDVTVVTAKERPIHVSGHPSREELAAMYELVRPEIAVPVHGEPIHLKAHAEFAKEQGVKTVFRVQNGELVKLAPGKPESLMMVPSGYLAVDGKQLQPEKGEVMRARRKMQTEGAVMVSFVIDIKGKLASEVIVQAPGVFDSDEQEDVLEEMRLDLEHMLSKQRAKSYDFLTKNITRVVRNFTKQYAGKKPLVSTQIHQL